MAQFGQNQSFPSDSRTVKMQQFLPFQYCRGAAYTSQAKVQLECLGITQPTLNSLSKKQTGFMSKRR